MSRPLVYLCGPITGMTYDDARHGWRKMVADVLSDHGIQCLSPMRAKDHLAGCEYINPNGYAPNAMGCPKGITTRDRYDTQRADLVLCNLLDAEHVSIGSMIEFGWADSARVPIVLAMENGDNFHDHAIVTELAGFILPTLEEAVDVVRAILVPGV